MEDSSSRSNPETLKKRSQVNLAPANTVQDNGVSYSSATTLKVTPIEELVWIH